MTNERLLLSALKKIAREAQKGKPNPDRIHAIATYVLDGTTTNVRSRDGKRFLTIGDLRP
jgi:hypothetical protein